MKKLIYTVILASAFLCGCSCGGDDEISKNNVNDSEAISMETSGVDMTTEGTSDLLNDATTGKNEQQTTDKNTEDDSSLNQGTSENRYTLDMWLTLASINGYTFGNCYENNNDIFSGCLLYKGSVVTGENDARSGPGGIGICDNGYYKILEIKEGKIAKVNYRPDGGKMISEVEQTEYAGGLAAVAEYSFDHPTTNGEFTKYWYVFFTKEDVADDLCYVLYLNEEYFSKEQALEILSTIHFRSNSPEIFNSFDLPLALPEGVDIDDETQSGYAVLSDGRGYPIIKKGYEPNTKYADALINDLWVSAGWCEEYCGEHLYNGDGTPSLSINHQTALNYVKIKSCYLCEVEFELYTNTDIIEYDIPEGERYSYYWCIIDMVDDTESNWIFLNKECFTKEEVIAVIEGL